MNRGIGQLLLRYYVTVFLALAMLGILPAITAHAQDENVEFSEHHAALKADESLQFDLAEPKMREVQEPRDLPPWMDALFDGIGVFLGYFFYVVIALLIATILYFIVREFAYIRFANKGKKDEGLTEAEAPLYVPDMEAAQILLGDVDKLAQEGNFADAIHTLLFRSIQDIEEKRPHSIRQSFTSREIADLKILSQDARTAFSKIGRVVEEGFFGQRPLGKGDFEVCRKAYVQFTRPKVWS